MEKVQVISVKPIDAEDEENSHPLPSQNSGSNVASVERGNIQNENLLRQKNNSFAFRSSKVSSRNLGLSSNGNTQLLRNNICNSSLKNAAPRASLKDHRTSEKNYSSHYKSGFSFPATSTNCFGRSDFRASYNERIRSGPSSLQSIAGYKKEKKNVHEAGSDFVYLTGNVALGSGLYRSNSSLELDHDAVEESHIGTQYLKREYGSHGSINVGTIGQQDSLFSVLQSYQQDCKPAECGQSTESTSPKVRSKINRLWEKDKPSIFKKFLPTKGPENKSEKVDSISEVHSNFVGTIISNSNAKHSAEMMETENKEDSQVSKPIRRAAIAHYDCRSLAAQFNEARLKSLLADRTNTTTGASAAALADSASLQNAVVKSSAEELNIEDVDHGGGRFNHLVSSCPVFHNEIGGESERIVSLSREITKPSRHGGSLKASQLHRSSAASSIGLLEPLPGWSFWSQTLCPYVRKSPILEMMDQGSSFYSTYFRSQEHQNWFGIDEVFGPVAISIKREKVEESGMDKTHSLPSYQYRFIFRTSDLYNCQGTIREESLNQRGDKGKGQGVKETVEYICPQLNLSCLRLGNASTETEEALVKVDELGIHRKFKVGVLYCRAGQKTEEDMYNNENSGPAFSEFLEILGQRVRLKNFDKYRGGLDKKTDSTGHYSVYAQYQGCEIMFHVSTLLPYSSTNKKQLLRKRHIGNDIATIIFQEPGALPFTPKNIRSHFQHVFIIVQAINPCTDSTHYSIAVSRFQDVPLFGPPIPENATFPKSRKFVDFLLAKVINGELAALRSEKFICMAARTKNEYLKDLALNHSTSTTLDTSSKFSLMGFSRASKKEKSRFKFVAHATVKGALSWNICLHDATLQQNVDCVLAISVDSVVVLEESSSSVIFSISCRSVLGWTTKPRQGLHLFYHQGECLILNLCQGISEAEGEEILNSIVARLSAVTQGAESQELILRRNPAGLLGFNVQQDGIITEVEPYGLAAQARLQQGSRLVEICTVALATLSQEQMVDLLKTSMTVTVTVIPPHLDGTPRRGCNVPTCTFLLGCSEGDYENLTPPEQGSGSHPKNRLKHLTRCDRSLSPPRSGSSSGYGTGSSSHSFSMDQGNRPQTAIYESTYCSQDSVTTKDKTPYNPGLSDSDTPKFSDFIGTHSSTSSGHSNDRWSESTPEELNPGKASSQFAPSSHLYPQRQSPFSQSDREHSPPPPPLPVRLYQHKKDIQLPSSLEHGSDGKRSPYGRYLHHNPGNTPGVPLPCYEQGNYAVPKSFPKLVSEDHFDTQKMGKSLEGTCDYDNTRFGSRTEGASGGNYRQSYRRNSSPLALEAKEDCDDSKRREFLSKARHSIPKSTDERGLQDHVLSSRSEDELSGSSGSSPHGFQKMRGNSGSTGSPSLSSRTQSPHNLNANIGIPLLKGDAGPSAAVKLKQSVQNTKNAQNRNSASLGTTNLQEELLKLINPDYLSDSESMGAEIREQKEASSVKSHSFPTFNVGEAPIAPTNPRQSIKPTEYVVGSSSTINTTGIYECLPSSYSTIGESEFSSRKKVFSRAGEGFSENERLEAPNQKIAEESSVAANSLKKPQTSEGLLLTARPATVISNVSTTTTLPYVEGRDKTAIPSKDTALHLNREADSVPLNSGPPVDTYDVSSKNNNPLNEKYPPTSTISSGLPTPIDDEWSNLVSAANQALEKGSENTASTGSVSSDSPDQNANPSPLPSEVIDTLSSEFHKCMPVYLKRFLSESKASGSQSHLSNENLECDDSNGNASRASPATASLPPSVDDGTKQLVHQLERALASEQRLSVKLKEEVAFLRNENSKLLKDSRAAAQQLHQFTEWFFKNIHKS